MPEAAACILPVFNIHSRMFQMVYTQCVYMFGEAAAQLSSKVWCIMV
jgi:hypothetical protein